LTGEFVGEKSPQVVVNVSTAVRSYDPDKGEVLWQCSGLGVNVTPIQSASTTAC
jgi:hypothetical protein